MSKFMHIPNRLMVAQGGGTFISFPIHNLWKHNFVPWYSEKWLTDRELQGKYRNWTLFLLNNNELHKECSKHLIDICCIF